MASKTSKIILLTVKIDFIDIGLSLPVYFHRSTARAYHLRSHPFTPHLRWVQVSVSPKAIR
jgi:hypothetical protein